MATKIVIRIIRLRYKKNWFKSNLEVGLFIASDAALWRIADEA